jgi:hypothetical protein
MIYLTEINRLILVGAFSLHSRLYRHNLSANYAICVRRTSNGKGVSVQIFFLQNYFIYLYRMQQLKSALRICGLKF